MLGFYQGDIKIEGKICVEYDILGTMETPTPIPVIEKQKQEEALPERGWAAASRLLFDKNIEDYTIEELQQEIAQLEAGKATTSSTMRDEDLTTKWYILKFELLMKTSAEARSAYRKVHELQKKNNTQQDWWQKSVADVGVEETVRRWSHGEAPKPPQEQIDAEVKLAEIEQAAGVINPFMPQVEVAKAGGLYHWHMQDEREYLTRREKELMASDLPDKELRLSNIRTVMKDLGIKEAETK